MKRTLSFIAIATSALLGSVSAEAFEPCQLKQCQSAIDDAQKQLQELQQLQAEQQKQWQLHLQAWLLEQELKQQRRLHQKVQTALMGGSRETLAGGQEEGAGKFVFVKADIRQAAVCKEIKYVDDNGVTRINTTDESCDEQVMRGGNFLSPQAHWDAELDARSRQIYPHDEQQRLSWLQDQENRKEDQKQGNSSTSNGTLELRSR
jgi:hypothetical protein